MSDSLRVIYAGTPDFAVPALQALLDSRHEVVAVYTQPDRPAGRGRKLKAGPVKALAVDHGVPVEQPASLKDAQAQSALAAYRADVMVVAAYGLLLPQAVLDTPRLGCINIHASLLPRWRGAAPIQRAILAGDAQSGVTIMQMDAGLDTGAMLLKRACPIEAADSAQDLHDRLAQMGAGALLEVLEGLGAGIHGEAQDASQAVYAPKLQKSEAELDWSEGARQLVRQVHAFNPWPVAQTRFQGEPLRIWDAEAVDVPVTADPGQVLTESAAGIDVATGQGILRITRLQLPGGRPLSVREFLNARSLLGQCLPS